MIWRIINDQVNNISIHDKISQCHINFIILIFNKFEQFDYCSQHEIWTAQSLIKTSQNEDQKDVKMNHIRVKKLMSTSITLRFFWFHQRMTSLKIRSDKLKNIMSKLFVNLEMWLKYTHFVSDYQYIILRTHLNCCIEFLNVSSIL